MIYKVGDQMVKFDGRACNRITLILAVVFVILLCINIFTAEAGVACRVNTGSVVAHIIHDGNRIEFNKTQRIWNVTAISFIPEDVAERLNKITKLEWRGGVMAKFTDGKGGNYFIYVQRKDLACP